MGAVKDLIKAYEWRWPQFVYYLAILEKAEKNLEIHPDITIEAAKAVIEGISKTVVQAFDTTITRKHLHKLSGSGVVGMAMEHLSSEDDKFDDDIIKRIKSLVHRVCEVRNERGDISHGQKVPKAVQSTGTYARLILCNQMAIAEYLLSSFLQLDFETLGEPEEDPEEKLENDFQAKKDFNEWLDETNAVDGISYSRALFQQDRLAYNALLEEYEAVEADE